MNIVKKGDLITYTVTSKTALMITRLTLKEGKVTVLDNRTRESFLTE